MASFRRDQPNVVIFGDSNTWMFGFAFRDYIAAIGPISKDQIVVKFKSGSTPQHWHAGDRKKLWTNTFSNRRAIAHGPSVADALTESTLLVVIGLGGNMAVNANRDQAIVLLEQVEAKAPKARIVWRGVPPATRLKNGKLPENSAKKQVKLGRYIRNSGLIQEFESRGFRIFDAETLTQSWGVDDRRVYIDLISLHAGGPATATQTKIGTPEDLRYEREILESAPKPHLVDHTSVERGPWASFVHARDNQIPSHVPREAAVDLVEIVGARGVLAIGEHAPPPSPLGGVRYRVIDAKALLRGGPPKFRSTGRVIPVNTLVCVDEQRGDNVRIHGLDGTDYGWTRVGNLALEADRDSATPLAAAPPPEPPRYRVSDAKALIRWGPPKFRSTGKVIPVDTLVHIDEQRGDNVRVSGVDGAAYGWTRMSNLEAVAAREPEPEPEIPEIPPDRLPLSERPVVADTVTVVDDRALLREGGPSFAPLQPRVTVPRFTRVTIDRTDGDYALIRHVGGESIGWTARSNLRLLFQGAGALREAPLRPAWPVVEPAGSGAAAKIAKLYNRLGGLIDRCAEELDVETAAVLAVFMAESGGKVQEPARATIRFENHALYNRWGKRNESIYHKHFRHKGGHRCCFTGEGNFEKFHGDQNKEYRVLEIAMGVAPRETALRCMSMGLPQIMGFNYGDAGFKSAVEMHKAFQVSEREQVLGFFDFLSNYKRGRPLAHFRRRRWFEFGKSYNGSDGYGPKVEKLYRAARQVLANRA